MRNAWQQNAPEKILRYCLFYPHGVAHGFKLMVRETWHRIALLLAWPACLLVADGMLRSHVIRSFSTTEWLFYVVSIVLQITFCGGLVWALRRLHALAYRRTYWLTLATSVMFQLLILGASYGVFFANGDLPDLFLLSYIRCEPANALIMARDSLRPHYVLALLPVMVVLCWLFHRFWLHPHLGVGVTKRSSILIAVTGLLALSCCWLGTASQGQCFVPLVRTPAILAMYAYNEVKGINPLPIALKPRTPETVSCQIPQPKVNVLVILNESLRRQNMQLFGHTRETTPKMVSFAAEHPANFFAFPKAYTNSTTTLLSVPSILTGISPLQSAEFRSKAPLPWQWAEAAGMRSFYFSSHDLSWCKMRAFLTTPPPEVFWDREVCEHPIYRDLGIDDHFTVEAAIKHLNALSDSPKPFFGVVHLNTNHYPYNTRDTYKLWKGTNQDLYDNTILETDAHAGRLIDALSAAGRLDDTVILFASDHGEAFNEHGYIAHFYCHYVETVSVPLWIYLPPALLAKRDTVALRSNLNEPVQNLDIMPTLLDCLGAWDLPETETLRRPMLGQSLLRPLARKRTLWITNTDEVMHSVIGLSSITRSMHYMIRTSSIPAKEDLYDLSADPGEKNNLWPHCTDEERNSYRQSFMQFPIPARVMGDALRQLPSAR